MRFRRLLPALVALLLIALTAPGAAAASVTPVRIVGGLSRPVLVTHAGDSRLFVVEQAGRIRIVSGTSIAATFLDMRHLVRSSEDGGGAGSEEGLLGLAFHPDYRSSGAWGYGRFYVYYTYSDGNNYVREYRVDNPAGNSAAGSTRLILRINHPTYTNHNGGMLAFGPDRMLYISTGDGGGSGDPNENAQNKSSLLGKILRINPTGTGNYSYITPSNNPFVGVTGDDRVWSYGLRNPWRFSFDRSLGTLWIGDVGQNVWEEIDRALKPANGYGGAGFNWGWDAYEGRACYEGPCPLSGHRSPVAVYSHNGSGGGNCSVTGGYVYRGSAYTSIRGLYFFADYCSGRIWTISGSSTSSSLTPVLRRDTSEFITSFGEGYTAELYFVTADGELYRITYV